MSASQLSAARAYRGYAPTLGWYLAKRWLVAVGGTLLGLGAFIALSNGLEAMRSVAESPTSASAAALMSLLKLPDMLVQLLPFAILIGTLVWLQRLNAQTELTAIRATGLPVRRMLGSAMLSCLLLGVVALTVFNPVAATLLKRYDRWQATISPPAAQGVLTPNGSLWLRQDLVKTEAIGTAARSIFLYGGAVQNAGTELSPATLFIFDASNTLVGRFDAARASLHPGQWQLTQVTVLRPNQPVQTEALVALPTRLTPGQLAASLNPPATLNVWELQKLLGVLAQNGWQAGPYWVAYTNLLVLPLLGLVMLLLAVPFGLTYRRTGGMVAQVGVGLGLGFAFFVLRNWANAYALAGRLEPWLAALVPVAAGLFLALFLFVLQREE
jgi:lipopolysaccharide export system permease protein